MRPPLCVTKGGKEPVKSLFCLQELEQYYKCPESNYFHALVDPFVQCPQTVFAPPRALHSLTTDAGHSTASISWCLKNTCPGPLRVVSSSSFPFPSGE